MSKKNNSEKNRNHSFYKEANKSILGQRQITPKRVFFSFFKTLKWMVFIFLIVITLWGCVNEFIIQTSKNLGQGVEFYQENDFIYPNMYQAEKIVGYTATDNKVDQGVKDKTESKSKPFNFKVVNPNWIPNFDPLDIEEYVDISKFEDSDTVIEDLQFDTYLINPSEIKYSRRENQTIEGVEKERITSYYDSPSYYSYNLNEISVNLTEIYNYSADSYIFDTTSPSISTFYATDGLYLPLKTVPYYFGKQLTEDVNSTITDEEYKYEVKDMVDLAYYAFDNSEGTVDGKININGYDKAIQFFNYDDEADLTSLKRDQIYSINGTLKAIGDPNNIYNYVSIFSLQTNSSDNLISSVSKWQQFINMQAFYNGTGILSKEDAKSNYFEIYNSLNEFANQDSDSGSLVDINDYVTSADFSALKSVDSYIYGGTQVFVIPIQTGFPIQASQETKNLIDGENGEGGLRDKNFRNWDVNLSENKDQGYDPYTQMYGWMLLDSAEKEDGTHDLLRAYSSEEKARTSDGSLSDLENEHYAFYADQRRLGWGTQDYDDTLITPDSNLDSVFDEKIKYAMNNNVYMKLDKNIEINGINYEYSIGSKFAGISSLEEIQTFDSSYSGVLPKFETLKDSDGNDVLWERSILSDSIIPTRQDSWGETRVSFVGWKDWDKAWNIQYGPLYGTFVFPLAQIAMFIGEIFNYFNSPWGTLFSIVIIVFLTRGLGSLLSLRGTKNQLKMQEVQTEVAKIKAKYSKYDFKEQPRFKQKQQQEIMMLYRKYEVNPMGSLGTIFITMPIFISLWIIISALPAYKLVIMGNFSWAVSAWYGIFNLGILFFLYLLVGISVGLVQGVSSKLPTWLSNKRKGIKRIDENTKASIKKQNRTQNIMIGVFVFMGLTVPALFAFYWITSGFFTIILELLRHWWRVHVSKQKKKNPNYETPISRFGSSIKGIFTKTKKV